jgi:hypothetical protein
MPDSILKPLQSPLKPIGVILWLLLCASIFAAIILFARGEKLFSLLSWAPFLIVYLLAMRKEVQESSPPLHRAKRMYIVASGILGLIYLAGALSFLK